MLGGAEGGGSLGGALLGTAEFGDGFGERGEADQQHDGGEPAFLREVGEGGDEPGGVAELVPGRGGRRDAPVGLAGGTLERVGGLAQGAAAERGGRHVQRVRCRVRGVSGGGRVAAVGRYCSSGLALMLARRDYLPTFIDASLIAAGTGALLWAVLAVEESARRRTCAGLAGFVALEAATFTRYTDIVVVGCAVVAVTVARRLPAARLPRFALA